MLAVPYWQAASAQVQSSIYMLNIHAHAGAVSVPQLRKHSYNGCSTCWDCTSVGNYAQKAKTWK